MKGKRLFCRKKASCGDGSRVRLNYYLLAERQEKNYGVRIEMRRRQRKEWAEARCITGSRKKIWRLLALLSRNLVTPCTLEEILEEQGNKI